MTLEQLVDTVESRIYGLGKRIWNEDPQAELREEAVRLSAEVEHNRAALERRQTEMEVLHRRLQAREISAALLVTHVETYVHVGDGTNAWRRALELDHIREGSKRDRAELYQHENNCGQQQTRLRHLEARLAMVMEKLYPR